MDLMIDKLENKWGKYETFENGYFNCKLPFISEYAKLNIFFNPVNVTEYDLNFSTNFNVTLPKFLTDFYKLFNGCRLFSDSLSIFGIQDNNSKDIMPFDIRIENNHNMGKINKKLNGRLFPYIFFGSLGGEYLFAFSKNNNDIFIFKVGETEPIKQFSSFEMLWTYYLTALINEYDDNGKKIHIKKEYENYPSIANTTTDIF